MTRVRGSHRKTIQAIEWCFEEGIDVSINCLLTKSNIEHVFDLEDWCVERGMQIKVDPMVTPKLNGDLSPTALRATTEQLNWFYRARAKKWPNSLPQFSAETRASYVCNAAKGKCAVTAYGDLLPCIEIREEMGNLVESRFHDIWQSESARKWRSLFVKDLKDYPLDGQGSMCEHCPGMAKNEDKDHLQTSKYAQTLSDIRRNVRREFLAEPKLEKSK
jgi:radical SAM protein with 4Fe4S-binding SPASM domain